MSPAQREMWRNAAQAVYDTDAGALISVRPAVLLSLLRRIDYLTEKLAPYDDMALAEVQARKGQ